MSTAQKPHKRHSEAYRKLLHLSRTLHTYLSMLAVVLFLFFGLTGFMLNHAAGFGLDTTRSSESTVTIPASVLLAKDKLALVEWLRSSAGVTGAVQSFDWPGEGDPFHLSFKSPKSQADVDIMLPDGQTHITIETRGVAGLLSRLHTARDAGRGWQLLLDATSILLISTSLTGIILWISLPKRRAYGVIALAISISAVVVVYLACVP